MLAKIEMKSQGRSGFIRFQSDKYLKDIWWEASGVPDKDILLAPLDLQEWDQPKGIKIEKLRQIEIVNELRKWLKIKKIKSNIEIPNEGRTQEGKCEWIQCNEKKLLGIAYCEGHFNQTLLG
jgi:hypothetical protein